MFYSTLEEAFPELSLKNYKKVGPVTNGLIVDQGVYISTQFLFRSLAVLEGEMMEEGAG